MGCMNFRFRPSVRRMRPYAPGKPLPELRRETGHPDIVKLASNENPLGPSPKAMDAVRRAAGQLHHYPDASGYELKRALAEKHDVELEQVVLGNGSDEIIAHLGYLFLHEPGDQIIVGEPSFVRYDATGEFADASVVKVPLDAEFRYDLDGMRDAICPSTKLIFLANPNNPTGTIITQSEWDNFLTQLPSGVLVVIDEAYYEFAREHPEYPDSIASLRKGHPIMVLRTFSKAYGLAGIRMGYGIGPIEVVEAFEKARQPFNVNALAQIAIIAALEDDEHIVRTLANNRLGLERLTRSLSRLGVRTLPSYANFIFADFGMPTRPLYEALLQHGVIVRPGDTLGSPNALRISVGTPEENDRLIQALEAALAIAR